MLRIPAICTFNSQKTVLAHIRMSGISGMGHKAIDLLGSWSCYQCHMVADGQRTVAGISREQARLYLLEGMARTIYELNRRGHIKYEF